MNCCIWKREHNKQNQKNKNKNDKNTTTSTSNSDEVLVLSDECLHVDEKRVEWIVDSATSYYATPHLQLFSNYRVKDFGMVKIGNFSHSKIVGMGNVCFETNMGYKLTMKYVRHVPNLRLNLMSRFSLDKQGYQNHFGKGKWMLTKGSLVFAKKKKCCTLYKTQGKVCNNELYVIEATSLELWHKRLGNMSKKRLQLLARKFLIPLAKNESLFSCDHCLVRKQHTISFNSRSKKKLDKLKLVYSNVCGPMDVEIVGEKRYFYTFINDATRKVWIYLLRSKDQVFQYFPQFHVMIERQTEEKLKSLIFDNGGKYTSREFETYCTKNGIRHEKTVSSTPQHNGVTEILNCTIIERVRCMLKTSKLSKVF